MKPGSLVQIIKHAGVDGRTLISYGGRLIESPPNWIAVRAEWTHGYVDIGALTFQPGDHLLEYFSLNRPFNAFALFRNDSTFAGWYCNVSRPTTVIDDSIHWHDLIVDVIVYPDGETLVLDEDELEASRLHETDPKLYRFVLGARDELLRMASTRSYPFSEVPEN